eukprot:jgi/Galph1/5079/GphlegSOOS_G3692.1
MQQPKPILYSYWRSSCSWRVRIALSLKNVDYEYRSVNLIKDGGEQWTPEYELLNPSHTVPTLIIDDLIIGQSVAIMEYLEETRPGFPLLPKDPTTRAKVRQVVETVNADTQPLQNSRVLQWLQKEVGDAVRGAWLKHFLTLNITALEKLLQKYSGTYSVGNELTFADCVIPPQYYSAVRYQIPLDGFPNFVRVAKTLDELPAFKKAHAYNQPDTPENPQY